jgi:predicted Zn finger-like uncharacterized protein
MFTVCSKCNLRLTVTATDLRAAQGYVRCGRCHNVFNALAALADDPARAAEQATVADTHSRPALTPPAPAPLAETSTADTSLEFNPASTNINEVFIEAAPGERTGTFESIILSGEAAEDVPSDAAESFEEEVVAPVPAPVALAPIASAPVAPVREEPAELPPARPATRTTALPIAAPPIVALPVTAHAPADEEVSFTADWSAPLRSVSEPPGVNALAASEIADALEARDTTRDTAIDEELTQAPPEKLLLAPAPATARVPRWLLQGAAAVLVLGLIAQVVNHYRDDLAATSVLRRPLTALYQSLGRPLEPRWDVASYEVRQLGASTDGAAPGDLVVRASISNRAPRVQPLPLLRVVMQDRFGNRVAARDLQPAEYLGRGAPQVSLMAPGQRVDVQVAFQDPGQAATGFEIDACMARRDHTVSCANDPSSR